MKFLRKKLWRKLKAIVDNMNGAWVVLGDFNEIVDLEEKKWGVVMNLRKCMRFYERINACNLVDLGYWSLKFTWNGLRWGTIHVFMKDRQSFMQY